MHVPVGCHALPMEVFDYIPHPHIEHRQLSGPTKTSDVRAGLHHDNAVGRFNAKFGLKITVIVGTMWTAYLFTLLALVSAPSAFKSGNLIIIVAWIAQTFLQLVLLPIIIVGQNVQAVTSDKRAEATYDDASAVLEEAKQIQAHLLMQDRAIADIIARLQSKPA